MTATPRDLPVIETGPVPACDQCSTRTRELYDLSPWGSLCAPCHLRQLERDAHNLSEHEAWAGGPPPFD